MRIIEQLCPPALLYLLYIVIQVGLDISLGMYIMAAVKLGSGLVGTFLLDAFCAVDLGVLSWVIISTPFLMTALATSIAIGLQLDKTITNYAVEKFTDKKVKAGEPPESSNPV